MIPNLNELTNLAAAMADPLEKPAVTAKRALELWKACRMELHWAEIADKRAQEIGGVEYEIWLSDEEFRNLLKPDADNRISLDNFLEACMPKAKLGTRISNWSKFRLSRVKEESEGSNLSSKSEKELLAAIDESIAKDRNHGFPVSDNLYALRDQFAEFRQRTKEISVQDRSEKGVRIKSINAVVKKWIKSEPLTTKEDDILKSLNEAEILMVIEKYEMMKSQSVRFRALILDLQTPVKGRPRRLVKKSKN